MTAPAILWQSGEAALATGGSVTSDWQATGVSIDTRTLAPGDLFVALSAARDGHDFVATALKAGAAAALVSRIPDDVAPDAPLLVVEDVQAALEALGLAARERCGARVAAITGSVGKTSAKEMLREALAGQGRVHAAEASYNNHWGVPLTLARMPADTDFAVIEIGMNHPGEIAPLARMARPDVALITTIAAAHLEAFDDILGIAREKASIVEGLAGAGIAILPRDVAEFPILRDIARDAGARIVTFGETAGADMRLTDLRVSEGATVAQVRAGQEAFVLKVATEGAHFARNALGVLAAAEALGADRMQSVLGLGHWMPPSGRGTKEVIHLDSARDGHSLTLIDDAFNANPTSMEAALDTLSRGTPRDGVGRIHRGRRIAILGDMLELGPVEARMHADLARLPAMRSVDVVHCVGPRMQTLWQALPETARGYWAATADEMAARADQVVDAGDIVLVKGSKGSQVSRVVDAIRKLGQRDVRPEKEAE